MEFLMMKRREFISRRGACVAARRARAAGGDRVPQGASPGPFAYCVAAFRHELREYRRAEGQTIDLRRSRRKLMFGTR